MSEPTSSPGTLDLSKCHLSKTIPSAADPAITIMYEYGKKLFRSPAVRYIPSAVPGPICIINIL
jgi:hypothetical protein